MCVAGCDEAMHRALSRRRLFRRAAAGAVLATGLRAEVVSAATPPTRFEKVIDLTHTLDPAFPTFFGTSGIELRTRFSYRKDGLNFLQWVLDEHSGTHIDAPLHFSENGADASALPIVDLVVPLAVIDVAAQAAANADYAVTPDDIKAWEERNGRLPDRAAVAIHTGWAQHLGTAKYRNEGPDGKLHFPGVHPAAAEVLIRERSVTGLLIDTLSFDIGATKDFPTHVLWLPSGRWGAENVANLDQVPPVGATIVVGGPKIRGATGGPSRLIALV
ncbi:Cyclase family protein [Rhodovastum atsumiense]|uniref:Cyclase family protein n=1 Tax=Rhodovastum atsumiense TaxID=504468 RepID=A0A5M6IWX9_9PROT|nr:cyclase family protein [Rhodovastum atsumiense]KAA5612751.1 cyclase family protein [Rhodovastum atsumiense]CAH2602687.1 Cyclase family protein [Rhodovastum atsumiense]